MKNPSSRSRWLPLCAALALGILPSACAPGFAYGEDTAVGRGERTYRRNCLQCHNRDPRLDGAIGPANAGSSLELLQRKVLENKYPRGYTPKRTTVQMTPLPYLRPKLPDLAAYLQQATESDFRLEPKK